MPFDVVVMVTTGGGDTNRWRCHDDGHQMTVATFCSLISSCTGKELPESPISMTGRLGLNGDVLAVGGMAAKLQHAHDKGHQCVVLPRHNYDKAKEVLDAEGWSDDLELWPIGNIRELVMRLFLGSGSGGE